jgi:Flp pilus assembly protein TadG
VSKAHVASRKRPQREEGAAALEFAIIGTLLMLLVMGVIEFGLFLSQNEVWQSAAREGARVAAVQEDVDADNFFTDADVAAAVNNAGHPYDCGARDGNPCDGTGGASNPSQFACDANGANCAASDCATAGVGELITVKWDQHFEVPNLFGLIPVLGGNREVRGVFRCE